MVYSKKIAISSLAFALLVLKPVIPAIATSAAASTALGFCEDSNSFTFLLDWMIEARSRDCAWITKNTDEIVTQNRIDKYCSRTHVKYACPLTCSACDTTCQDNDKFLFQTETGERKNCAWIQKEDVELRQMLYCYADDNHDSASEIGDNCVASCGFCKADLGLVPSNVDWEHVGSYVNITSDEVLPVIVKLSKDGKVLAVSSDNVRVFYQCSNGKWCQIGGDIFETFLDFSTLLYSMALSDDGKTIAVGYGNDWERTAVQVHRWNGSSWNQISSFGLDGQVITTFSLSGNGTTIAVGGFEPLGIIGTISYIRVYQPDYDNPWSPWKQLGSDIILDSSDESVQWFSNLSVTSMSLSEDGMKLAVAFVRSGLQPSEGEISAPSLVHVYEWTGYSWCKMGQDISYEIAYILEFENISVNLSSDGKVLAIGPIRNDQLEPLDMRRKRHLMEMRRRTMADDNSTVYSFARAYEWDGSSWNQLGTDIDGRTAAITDKDTISGMTSISLSGNGRVLATSVLYEDLQTEEYLVSGYTAMYHWDGASWNLLGAQIDEDPFVIGTSVSLNGNGTAVAVGSLDLRILLDGGGDGSTDLNRTAAVEDRFVDDDKYYHMQSHNISNVTAGPESNNEEIVNSTVTKYPAKVYRVVTRKDV